jgi:chaperonin GroEL (HSP60 family)
MVGSVVGPPLQRLVANAARYQRPIKFVIVKAPEFGTLRMGMMDDIAHFTGAKIIDSQRGNRPDSFTADHIGRVDHIVASMKSYTFFMPEDQAKLASERVDKLRFALETETDQDNIARLEKRIALLTAGIGVFHVGGLTEQEQTYRKDLAEDAIKATLSAIKHGYVKGGGSVMWEFSQKVKPDHMKVFMSPAIQISENIGIYTHEFLDGLSGIFDPSKVSVESYRNALSVIKTSLDSKYMLHD